MYIEKAKWFFFQLVPATLFASSKWIGCIFWREHTTHLHIFVIITWCLVHSNWRQHSNHQLVFWILRLRKNRIEVKEILIRCEEMVANDKNMIRFNWSYRRREKPVEKFSINRNTNRTKKPNTKHSNRMLFIVDSKKVKYSVVHPLSSFLFFTFTNFLNLK